MSQPYRTAVSFASALYAAVGLFLCYRLARRYARPFAAFAAVVALWWATPVAYYMYVAPGMSHAASLFTVALFFSLWPWAVSGGASRWAVWGASAGTHGSRSRAGSCSSPRRPWSPLSASSESSEEARRFRGRGAGRLSPAARRLSRAVRHALARSPNPEQR